MHILFLNPSQFGYKAGYYHYCKYLLLKGHIITYVGLDKNLPKLEIEGIDVRNIKSSGSSLNWRISYFQYLRKINYRIYDVVFISYSKFSFLYRIIGVPRRAVIDIRSGDLSSFWPKRLLFNGLIKLESCFFQHITILSESLKTKLKLSSSKTTILSLGGDDIYYAPRTYDFPRLIYIGTFYKRNIRETIEAVLDFTIKYPDIPIHYDIIGFGTENEEFEIVDAIKKNKLDKTVIFHGRKNYSELESYIKTSNVGLSYVPKVPYFDNQPPTKTFEYILSGLVCIATSTTENKRLIVQENGILCDDTVKSLSESIYKFYINRQMYNSRLVRDSLLKYSWANIVETTIEPLFVRIAEKGLIS